MNFTPFSPVLRRRLNRLTSTLLRGLLLLLLLLLGVPLCALSSPLPPSSSASSLQTEAGNNPGISSMLRSKEGAEALSAQSHEDPRPLVRIGFLAFDGETTFIHRNDEMLAETARYLADALPEYRIDIHRYGNEKLLALVAERKLELFLTAAGAVYRAPNAIPIATLVTPEAPDPNFGVAGVFIVHRDSDIRTLMDAKGRTAVGTGPKKFMNWQVAVGEIARLGFDPETFFSHIRFVGSDLVAVPKLVAAGKAEVGVMRACTLEPMLEADPALLEKLRVLEPRPVDGLRCLHSSALYPNWTFAAVSGAPPEIVKRTTEVLLAMPPEKHNGLGWSIATRTEAIDELFRLLKTGPYEHLRVLTFEAFLAKAKPFLLAALVLFLAWVAHWRRVEVLVRKRTADLKAAQAKAQDAQKKLSALLRLGVVNQFSTVLAHELHQPLAATKYLADALELIAHSSDIDRKKLAGIAAKLSASVDKSAEIVERVRAYAKSRAAEEAFDLTPLLRDVHANIAEALHAAPILSIETKEPVMVSGDPVALRIAFANLLKNACEAACGAGKSFVEMKLAMESKCAVIQIENDGAMLAPDFIERIGRPMQSEKLDGMGYGILIAVTILESHRGALRFIRRDGGGLIVTVRLPITHPLKHVSEAT